MKNENEMNFPQPTPENVENIGEPVENSTFQEPEAQPVPERELPPADIPPSPLHQPQPPKRAKNKGAGGPLYVGRVTLGIALIAVGLLITASLFVPGVDFLVVAKFAPLILVLVGVEVLVGMFRAKNRPVKVGFGLTLLCLVLIFGAVGAALLPDVWDEYGPGSWERRQAAQSQITQRIYDQVDLSIVDHVQVDVYDFRKGEPVRANVQISLLGEYEDAAAFAADSLKVLQSIQDNELDSVFLEAGSSDGQWGLSVQSVASMARLTPEQLEKRVDYSQRILDENLDEQLVSQKRYKEMKEKGLLVEAEAVENARQRGRQEGYERAQREQAEARQIEADENEPSEPQIEMTQPQQEQEPEIGSAQPQQTDGPQTMTEPAA